MHPPKHYFNPNWQQTITVIRLVLVNFQNVYIYLREDSILKLIRAFISRIAFSDDGKDASLTCWQKLAAKCIFSLRRTKWHLLDEYKFYSLCSDIFIVPTFEFFIYGKNLESRQGGVSLSYFLGLIMFDPEFVWVHRKYVFSVAL